MEGFCRTMALRPEFWVGLDTVDDPEVRRALFVLTRLAALAVSSSDLEPMEIDERLEAAAPDLIPLHLEILHRAWPNEMAGPAPFAPAPVAKVGRNDPCPCGSGKKFKKCCLN